MVLKWKSTTCLKKATITSLVYFPLLLVMDKLKHVIDYLLRELFSSYYFPPAFFSEQYILEQFILDVSCSVQHREPHVGAAVVQSPNRVRLSVTPWTAAHQASLSFTICRSLLKLMSIDSVMLSNHLILCHPLLLLPSIFPSIRVFSNESALCIRWPKHWSFSFSISPPVNIQDWFILGLTGLISFLSKGLSRVFSSTTLVQSSL